MPTMDVSQVVESIKGIGPNIVLVGGAVLALAAVTYGYRVVKSFIGRCPQPLEVEVFGAPLKFDYSPVCELASKLRTLVLLLGALVAGLIGRVFYCTHVGRQVVVLHSFVKKTQETPQHELRVAQARLREVRNG